MIKVIETYDWVGIYKDDILLIEDHTLCCEQVLDALDIKYEWEEINSNDFIKMFRNGRLPKNYSEFEKLKEEYKQSKIDKINLKIERAKKLLINGEIEKALELLNFKENLNE